MSTFALPQLESDAGAVGGTLAEQAASVIAVAQAEADAIRAAAHEEGRAQGFAAARDEARAEIDTALATLEVAARDVLDAREALCEVAERRAIDLALAIAEKVVGAELAVRPELVLDACSAALRRTIRRDGLVLEVHPDDLELVREGLVDLGSRLGDLGRLEAVGERRVARGGCILRTSEGEIEATHAAQLERARDTIESALRA
jgi:flagellar assembly protein FliH